MSDYVWEDAWVLLAVKYAVGEHEFASKEAVVKAGDFINHAVFLDQELEHAQRTLSSSGLLSYKNEIYSLGPNFQKFWLNSGAKKHRSVHKQLEVVINELGIA